VIALPIRSTNGKHTRQCRWKFDSLRCWAVTHRRNDNNISSDRPGNGGDNSGIYDTLTLRNRDHFSAAAYSPIYCSGQVCGPMLAIAN